LSRNQDTRSSLQTTAPRSRNRDFKFGVGNKGVEGFVPPDEEPGVIDEFEGEVSLGHSVNAIGGFLRSFVVLPEGFTKKVFW
jgi:hypothetical protein